MFFFFQVHISLVSNFNGHPDAKINPGPSPLRSVLRHSALFSILVKLERSFQRSSGQVWFFSPRHVGACVDFITRSSWLVAVEHSPSCCPEHGENMSEIYEGIQEELTRAKFKFIWICCWRTSRDVGVLNILPRTACVERLVRRWPGERFLASSARLSGRVLPARVHETLRAGQFSVGGAHLSWAFGKLADDCVEVPKEVCFKSPWKPTLPRACTTRTSREGNGRRRARSENVIGFCQETYLGTAAGRWSRGRDHHLCRCCLAGRGHHVWQCVPVSAVASAFRDIKHV